MDYIVKIDKFEGPLDLLLHLVRSSEIDIYEISIFDITKQYISYIKAMEKLNLEVASEYLVMAADLIRIKSAMLLPKPPKEDAGEVEEDPRQQLIDKLIEYKKYKSVSEEFDEYKKERELSYTKVYNDEFEISNPIIIDTNVDSFDLLKALNKMNRRKEALKPLTTVIEKSEISVEERMDTLYSHLKTIDSAQKFSELFTSFEKSYVITTFLAILELVKEDKVQIYNISEDDFELSLF